MNEPKKRQPGRPSLPDEEKRSRNLTFRSRGDLRDRLNGAASQAGRSISEEIEFRLEASFTIHERIAELGQRLERTELAIEATRAEAKADQDRLLAEVAKGKRLIAEARAESDRAYAEVEAEIAQLEAAGGIFDALMGDDIASKEAVRGVALLLATNPGWARSAEGVQKMTQSIEAIVQAAAKRIQQ